MATGHTPSPTSSRQPRATRLKAIQRYHQATIPAVALWRLRCPDQRMAKRRPTHHKTAKIRTGQELKTHNNMQAVNLAKRGQIRRAASKADETQAKANMQAPEVQAQAQVKHPQRQEANYWDPKIITWDTPELQIDCKAKLKKLDPLAAPGPSGMSNLFLSTLSSKVWPSGSEAEKAVHASTALQTST